MLDAYIKFFDIKKCGFYLHGRKKPEFGDICDTLQKLNSWAGDGKLLVNTNTFEPDPDNDLRNTYFCDWYTNKKTKDHLLVLWNEIPNDSGVIYGMNPKDKPGNTAMLTTGFGSTPAIPGFPSYYWFIPEKNVYATIKFAHSMQGKLNLENYLNGFLANKSPYRVIDAEGTVIGYSADSKPTDTSGKVSSKFHSLGRKQEELEAELLANLSKITKIIKKEKLKQSVIDDRNVIERFFSGLLANTPVFVGDKLISHELQFSPNEEQLRRIIHNYAELNIAASIRNVGFCYNNGKKIMLSGTSVAFSTSIAVTRAENQILNPSELLEAITAQRDGLLRSLDLAAFEIEEAGT